MPIPVKKNGVENKLASELTIDYSWLTSHMPAPASEKKVVLASDKDATLLMELWMESDRVATDKIKPIKNSKLNASDIMRLKTRGLLDADGENLKLTSSGKTIIATMALGENNHFLKNQKSKSYTEIMASMDKRGKIGYRIPKFAASELINMKKTAQNEVAGPADKVPCYFCKEPCVPNQQKGKVCDFCDDLMKKISGSPDAAIKILKYLHRL